MIILTNQEFLERGGINLEAELKPHNTDATTFAKLTLKRWSELLYKEVRKKSIYPIPVDEKLSSHQVGVIKESIVNLGLYILTNGDPIANGGKDENGNNIEIVLPSIIDDLRMCGLIKTSFGRRWFS